MKYNLSKILSKLFIKKSNNNKIKNSTYNIEECNKSYYLDYCTVCDILHINNLFSKHCELCNKCHFKHNIYCIYCENCYNHQLDKDIINHRKSCKILIQ